MHRQEFIINILLIIGSLLSFFIFIPQWTPESEGYGLASSTIPKIMAASICILAILQIIWGLKKGIQTKNSPINLDTFIHLVKYFGVMTLIFPAWKYLGFIFGGMAVLFLLYLVTGIKKIVPIVIVSICVPLVAYVFLWYGLRIPTP